MSSSLGFEVVGVIPFRQSSDRRGASNLVIAGLVPAIHPTTSCGACCEMGPGNKCRDDSVGATTPGSKFFRAGVTPASARRIAEAYAKWGKGIHPAALNFGDCFAYEVAKEHGCRLLYVGEDFARTDVEGAL